MSDEQFITENNLRPARLPPVKPSEDLPLWAERYRKIVIPPPQAPAERQTSGLYLLAPLD